MDEYFRQVRRTLLDAALHVDNHDLLTKISEGLEVLAIVESEVEDMTSSIAQLTFLLRESQY